MLITVMVVSFFITSFVFEFFDVFLQNNKQYWGRMLIGDNTIIHKNYKDFNMINPPSKEVLFLPNNIEKYLNQRNINFSKRLRTSVLLENYKSEQGSSINLIGGHNDQNILTDIEIIEGRWPKEGANEILISQRTAGNLNLSCNDSIVIYTSTIDNYTNYDIAVVSGLYGSMQTDNFCYDLYFGYTSYSFIKTLKNMDKNQISEIAVNNLSLYQKLEIAYQFNDIKLLNIWSATDITKTMSSVFRILKYLVLFLICIVIMTSLYGNFSLMVKKRHKEIGILLTYGESKYKIAMLFITEYTFLLLYSFILGSIITLICTYLVNAMEIRAIIPIAEIIIGAKMFIMCNSIEYFIYTLTLIWVIMVVSSIIPIIDGINQNCVVKLFRE